ncbi:MAG TPA: right-handed parallel beta-helix repeat-containing protein, partial [Candidatus Acidoferrum sp.]|nr:right-handed parallel beta-helix repeat-containing protein [Candidatus Acidoferrum sp.]
MKMTTTKLLAAALAVAGFALNAPAQQKVNSAQTFQNALTMAANGGGSSTIYLEQDPTQNNGYYIGNFNYNSVGSYSLTIIPDPTVNPAPAIKIDGTNGGRGLSITLSGAVGDVTVSDITFVRNCGSSTIGALRIAGSSGGNNTVSSCYFLSPAASEGMGVEIASGKNTTISGCHIIGKTNSTAGIYDGHGISIAGVTGTTVLSNNTIIGNYGGWGAYITAASTVLLVNGNLFQTNASGGLYFYPSGETDLAQVSIVTNVFDYNKGNGGAYLGNFDTVWLATNLFSGNPGGGAYIANGVTVTNVKNTYVGNTGGGLDLANLTTAVSTGNTFSGNSYSSYGGAEFYNVTTTIVTGNTFSGNISSGAAGGADCYLNKYLTLSNNTFSGNKANNGSGGGAYIYNSGNCFATVIGNTFTANTCGGNYGGGALYVQSVSNTITQNTFSLNSSADGGGAIYDTAAPVIIMTENLLVNNSQSAGSATGGAIFVNATATLDMVNNTVFGNSSAGGGGGVSFQVSGLVEVLSVFNNIIWGNSITGGSGGDVYITGSGSQKLFLYNDANDLSGVWDLAVGINQDPAFFDPINGDYHFPEAFTTGPYAGSLTPCANAGTTAQNTTPALPLAALALVTAATATDLDGNPRVNTSGYVDIGCYEFNSTAFHPADILGANSISAADFNGVPNLSL